MRRKSRSEAESLRRRNSFPPSILSEKGPPPGGSRVGKCDYIAGMTDAYSVEIYQDLFIPKSWAVKWGKTETV